MAQRKITSTRISRNGSRCSSVEPLETLEEEPGFRHFINRQEVVAEDTNEEEEEGTGSDSDGRVISPTERKISFEKQLRSDSRKTSDIDSKLPSRRASTAQQSGTNSATSSQCPSRRWSRHSSPTRGEILRMEDEMVTVNRGGQEMTIPLNITHHIPPRLLGQLDEEGVLICDRMLNTGYTMQEIVEYFKTYVPVKDRIAKKFKEFKELTEKLKSGDVSESEKMRMLMDIMKGQNLSQKDFLDLMGTQFGDKTKQEMEKMLSQGMSMEEVLEHFQRQAEKEELKDKLQALLDDQNASTEQVFNTMREQLGADEQAKIEEMLKKGMTMDQIIDHFMNGGMDEGSSSEVPSKEDMREQLKSKISKLLNDPNASTEDIFNTLKSQLSQEEQKKMDEMLKMGMSMDDIINHFMKGGMDQDKQTKQNAKEELKAKLKNLLNDPNASTEEVFSMLKNQLGLDDQAKIDQMIAQGMSMEEIINHFMKGGMDEFDKDEKQKVKDELKEKLQNMLNDPNAKTEDVFNMLKNQLGVDDQAKVDEMLKQGMSMDEIINHFMKGGLDEDKEAKQQAKEELKEKLKLLLKDPNANVEDVFNALKKDLGSSDQAKIDEMLAKGMSMEQIIDHFMKGGLDEPMLKEEETEFSRRMKELAGGKELSEDQLLELMKTQLGEGSKAELEEMLKKGYTLKEVMDHFMKHGKTEEEEQKEFADKIKSVIEGKNLSKEQKLNFLKENLSKEAKEAMEDLLAQGYSMDEVIELFKKHGNNLNAIDEELSNPRVDFGDEPPDAHLHANRNVFSVISIEEIKSTVPYMSPSSKGVTFKQFIDRIQELVKGRGLTHREILDLMESRLGGSYLAEVRDLRSQGLGLQGIVEFLIRKDAEIRQQARRKARLEAQAKVDEFIDLKRKLIKNQWGVQINYTYSDENGLHLVIDQVDEGAPAWEAGVRSGDVIVTVNGWLITVMDRPQVAVHLFQAGANIVKLGILKASSKSHDIIALAGGQMNSSSNMIGVF